MTSFFDKSGAVWTLVIISVMFSGICLGLLINGQSTFLPSLNGFAASFGTLLLGIAAIKGVNQWKAEIRGKTEFEAAKNYLLTAYKLRKSIAACRNPMISAAEFPDNYEPLNKDPNHQASAFTEVYNTRWSFVADSLVNFDAASLEAEVLWGKQVHNMTVALRKCASRLRNSISSYLGDIASNGAHFKANPRLKHKAEQDVFFPGLEEGNELESLLSEAIASIETFTKSHLPNSE